MCTFTITAWYSWCSPYLIDVSKKPKDTKCLEKDDMIKIGHPLLIIGHNVSYDRARIAEQYDLELPRTRFLDTMALHIAVVGMTSGQRKVKLKEKSLIEKQSEYLHRYVVYPGNYYLQVFIASKNNFHSRRRNK